MHNISTECLFSFITNPPGGYPPEIHRNSTGNPPEIRRKSTGNDSGKRPESFKFWCQFSFCSLLSGSILAALRRRRMKRKPSLAPPASASQQKLLHSSRLTSSILFHYPQFWFKGVQENTIFTVHPVPSASSSPFFLSSEQLSCSTSSL